ncbi:MAG: substrate-binding domain-containing protein, partial [Azonexus sp.]
MAHSFRSLILALGLLVGAAHAEETLVVASTTSTEQSGLFGWILPKFEQSTGLKVRVVAVGTGQALDIGRRGDADVLFVHDRAAEDKFVAEAYGSYRQDVMYNDFVFIGPKDDPAKIRNAGSALNALK